MIAACATCDAASLVAPPGVDDLVISYNGDTVLSVGRLIVPEVSVLLNGEPLTDPRLAYTSSDPTTVEVTPEGQLFLRRLGTASITVAVRSSLMPASPPTATWNLHVVAESLSVSAGMLSFSALGQTAVIAASAFDFNGLEIENPPLRWESSRPEAVAVTQRGIVTAKGGGTAEIRAILGPDTTVVMVTVAQVLARYTLSHDDVTLESLGDTLRVIATARDANGGVIEPSPTTAPVWTSRDATVADVTQGGKVTARRNASTWIIAQRGAIADSVRLSVDQLTVRVVVSSATGFGIDAIDGQLQLTAQGFDRNNNPDVVSRPTWSSLDPDGAQVDPASGLVTGRSTGDHRIVATIDNAADTVIINVNNPPASLVLTPATVAITSVNDTVPLSVGVFNARGATVSAEITWRSTDTTVIRVIPGSRIEARGAGSARVIASTTWMNGSTSMTLADTTTVTVTNHATIIDMPQAGVALRYPGHTVTPEITIRNARGDALPRDAVAWRSDDATIASVSSTGVITAGKVGVTFVRATSSVTSDLIEVTVTNNAYSVRLSMQLDTLTVLGRTATYTGEVRNEAGTLIPGATIIWRSTATNVGTVSNGVVSTAQFGTTLIIGQVDQVADTIAVVVRNPSVLWVDNSIATSERFGTLARPYARIQDAIVAADAGDTVVVRRGFGYTESLSISRRITLIGDSSAYVAGNRAASFLPAIAHDTGTAGITATTTAPVVIRYLALTHSVDGPAIVTNGADVRIDNIHVNPVSSSIKLGRGILVRDAPAFAVLADITVRNVRGYGVRLERVVQGEVTRVNVTGVDSVTGTRGAGIDVYRGSANDVRSSFVAETQGPGVLLDSTSAASVVGSRLTGRSVLLRVRGVTGTISVVELNDFDLTVLPGAADTRGSASDGRSGLEVINSSNIQVRNNTFLESGTALMDGIRLINAKGGGAFLGVTISRNRFTGGRYSVRSEKSSWTMAESRSEGAVNPIFATDADTIQLVSDTLVSVTGDACITSAGAASRVDITSSLFTGCGSSGSLGGRAIRMTGNNTSLTVRTTTMGGPNQTAVHFSGRDLTLRGNSMSGRGTRTVSGFMADGVIDAATTNSATITGNIITDYAGFTGASLAVTTATIDSNIVARNNTGVNLLSWNSLSATDNDFSDHELLAVRNGRAVTAPFGNNWWGDARGPRRTTAPAATGDSVGSNVSFGTVRAAPLNPGAPANSIRMVRGSGQSALRGTALPTAFTVRVVDAQGRPVAGTTVTFAVTAKNGSVSAESVVTNASGLAETTLTLGASAGTNEVTASISAPGTPTTVSFTATGT